MSILDTQLALDWVHFPPHPLPSTIIIPSQFISKRRRRKKERKKEKERIARVPPGDVCVLWERRDSSCRFFQRFQRGDSNGWCQLMHTLARTRTCSHMPVHTRTHSHTLSHTLTHSHTRTHWQDQTDCWTSCQQLTPRAKLDNVFKGKVDDLKHFFFSLFLFDFPSLPLPSFLLPFLPSFFFFFSLSLFLSFSLSLFFDFLSCRSKEEGRSEEGTEQEEKEEETSTLLLSTLLAY